MFSVRVQAWIFTKKITLTIRVYIIIYGRTTKANEICHQYYIRYFFKWTVSNIIRQLLSIFMCVRKHLNCILISTHFFRIDCSTSTQFHHWEVGDVCVYASFNGLAWDLQRRLCHIMLYCNIKCYVCTNCVFVINMSIGLWFSAYIIFVDDVYKILFFCNV
jgi:hypothetical protein